MVRPNHKIPYHIWIELSKIHMNIWIDFDGCFKNYKLFLTLRLLSKTKKSKLSVIFIYSNKKLKNYVLIFGALESLTVGQLPVNQITNWPFSAWYFFKFCINNTFWGLTLVILFFFEPDITPILQWGVPPH